MKRRVTLAATVLLAINFSMAALAADPVAPALATIDSGDIMGMENNGLYSFLGIPYGQAERFQMPVRNDAWDGTRNCLFYGEVAPSDSTLASTASMNSHEYLSISLSDQRGSEEKCLNLNVWTNSLNTESKKPVLVFMHGGGLANGSSSEIAYYHGEGFAKTQDCVFVSVNARLNCLGYLDVSAYGGEEYKNSTNCGLADMVLSLEWVRDNIAQFGGDPENVTILGQSGGGTKVTSLACLPAAEGLFNKVCIISGGYTRSTTADTQAATEMLVESLGLTDEDDVLQTLLDMSYEELYTACKEAGIRYTCAADGEYFPELWYNAETGEMSKIAKQYTYLVGNTFAEMMPNQVHFTDGGTVDLDYYKPTMTDEIAERLITEKFGDQAEAAKEAFVKAYPEHDVVDCVWMNARSGGMLTGNVEILEQNEVPVYAYVASYEQGLMGGSAMVHTGDLAYWFNNLDSVKYQILGDEENAYKVADEMSSALAAFCATGDPSTEELSWPVSTAEESQVMVFDTVSEVKPWSFDAEITEIINSLKK